VIGIAHTLASSYLADWYGHDWQLANPRYLMVAWAGPVIGLLILFLSSRSNRKQRLLADEQMIETLIGKRRYWNSLLHAILTMLIILVVSVAVARPQSDPQEIDVEARGRDVVFLVDVSRSMLARDVAPNRLEKSKLWINDLVDELGSDRVGLVAFAGSSAVLSPLTTDRLFFRLALEELSPKSVLVGGTNIGDAIRKTMDMVFIEDDESLVKNYRDIVLISDGEDQESLPIEAARLAGSRGVRVIAIGIGSDEGAIVPWDPDSTTPKRTKVRSKLESGTLRAIAAASPGGVYLQVGTGTVDLAKVYKDLISTADQRTIETASHLQYTERYMVFLAAGIVLILLDRVVIPSGNRRALA
jgi:Ca-activated chloride channel homolog